LEEKKKKIDIYGPGKDRNAKLENLRAERKSLFYCDQQRNHRNLKGKEKKKLKKKKKRKERKERKKENKLIK